MRHHILIKWTDNAPHPDLASIRALFLQTLQIPGVHDVSLHPNVIERPNRYDLMIVISMEKEALAAYDASEAHHRWKEAYSSCIASKAIFDCE